MAEKNHPLCVPEYENLTEEARRPEEAFARLIEILKVLRRECPWDREQTHESLRVCMLEEAYEMVEAINTGNYENLEEELGDVFLQVLFHSSLAAESKRFDLTDVINKECDKMIRRHPHVFLREEANSIDKALEKWENVKRREHGEASHTARLSAVPKALPALTRSFKIQARAAEVGFDWDDVACAFQKIDEEVSELKEAAESKQKEKIVEELGDLIFSAVNTARFLGVDPEEALNLTSEKFIKRFSEIEKAALASGKRLEEMSLEEMDILWEYAKTLKND